MEQLKNQFWLYGMPNLQASYWGAESVPQIQTEIQKVLDLEAKVSELANKVIEKKKIDMAPTKN